MYPKHVETKYLYSHNSTKAIAFIYLKLVIDTNVILLAKRSFNTMIGNMLQMITANNKL